MNRKNALLTAFFALTFGLTGCAAASGPTSASEASSDDPVSSFSPSASWMRVIDDSPSLPECAPAEEWCAPGNQGQCCRLPTEEGDDSTRATCYECAPPEADTQGAACETDADCGGATCEILGSGVGECRQRCGGEAGLTCPSGTACQYEVGASGDGGAEGSCAPDGVGTCPLNGATVCGCNGKTYENECLATLAGASLAHEGACSGG